MFTFAQIHVLAAVSISIWPYCKILCSGQRYGEVGVVTGAKRFLLTILKV